ncbi:MAG: hypothetical protein DRQ24_10270 [Candidatus Latescibacterota bacterium]|nr:MAG: hypothetical protein DRQ24_10270 [Candidatus Latescibacterota bacterium]
MREKANSKDLEKLIDEYMKLPYRIEIEFEDGLLFARIPDLPGCLAHGETPEELFKNLEISKRLWFEAKLRMGFPIPKPQKAEKEFKGRVLVRMPKSLHRRLAEIAKLNGVSLNMQIVSFLSEAVGRIASRVVKLKRYRKSEEIEETLVQLSEEYNWGESNQVFPKKILSKVSRNYPAA